MPPTGQQVEKQERPRRDWSALGVVTPEHAQGLLKRHGPRMTEEDQYRTAAEIRGQILPTVADIRKMAMGSDAVATIDIAIKMERDAVLYYTKMAATVGGSDLTVMNKIIDAERSHVEVLQKHRMGLL